MTSTIISGSELRKRLDDLLAIMPETPAAWRKHAEAVQRLVHQLHAEANQLRQQVMNLENAAEQIRHNSQEAMSKMDKLTIENESLRGQITTLKARELARQQHAVVEARREDEEKVERMIYSICSVLTTICHRGGLPKDQWESVVGAAVFNTFRVGIKRTTLLALKERFQNVTVDIRDKQPDSEQKIQELRRLVNQKLDEAIERFPEQLNDCARFGSKDYNYFS